MMADITSEPKYAHALTQQQYDELVRYRDGEPCKFEGRPNRNLIRRNLLALAPTAGTGYYRITEFGRAMLSEHRWKGDGVVVSEPDALDALAALGMLPDEVVALAEHAKGEAWVWGQMQRSHEDPHTCRAIADFFLRREATWRRLAVLVERDLEDEDE